MWGKNKAVRAFTLLECLVALLVISGAVQVYQSMSRLLFTDVTYLKKQEKNDWLLFSQQLAVELEGTRFERIEGDKLYVKKGQQELAFGKSRSDDFRKTNADGRGYQPMLYGLKKVSISGDKKLVTIQLTFKNGLERTYVYAFQEES